MNLMFVRLTKVSTNTFNCNNTLPWSTKQILHSFLKFIPWPTINACMLTYWTRLNNTSTEFRFLYLWSWQEFRLQIDQGLDANRPQFITVFFSKYKVHVLPQFKSIPSAVDLCIYWAFFSERQASAFIGEPHL